MVLNKYAVFQKNPLSSYLLETTGDGQTDTKILDEYYTIPHTLCGGGINYFFLVLLNSTYYFCYSLTLPLLMYNLFIVSCCPYTCVLSLLLTVVHIHMYLVYCQLLHIYMCFKFIVSHFPFTLVLCLLLDAVLLHVYLVICCPLTHLFCYLWLAIVHYHVYFIV